MTRSRTAPSIVAAAGVHTHANRERAVDAVDEQCNPKPGESRRKIAFDRRVKREQSHRAAGGREQMDGETRGFRDVYGSLFDRHALPCPPPPDSLDGLSVGLTV